MKRYEINGEIDGDDYSRLPVEFIEFVDDKKSYHANFISPFVHLPKVKATRVEGKWQVWNVFACKYEWVSSILSDHVEEIYQRHLLGKITS
jgi:hypothetical protein